MVDSSMYRRADRLYPVGWSAAGGEGEGDAQQSGPNSREENAAGGCKGAWPWSTWLMIHDLVRYSSHYSSYLDSYSSLLSGNGNGTKRAYPTCAQGISGEKGNAFLQAF